MRFRTTLDALWQPALLLIVAVIYASPSLSPLPATSVPVLVPGGLAAVGIFLGWRFHKSAAVFALCTLLFCYHALGLLNGAAPSDNALGQVLYAGTAIILPLNLAIFAFLEERGLTSRWGLTRAALLAGQGGVLLGLTYAVDPSLRHQVADLFHYRIFSPEADRWTFLPQPALIAYGLAFGALATRLALTSTPISGGMMGALIAGGGAYHLVGQPVAVDVMFTAAIATTTAAVAQEAFRMAFIDELTHIPGRRALMAEMKRLGGRYVVAMADIDHFKSFNDTHGHDVGDQVLKMVAGKLATVSGGGKAYRYGGEEFTILFAGKTIDEALPHLDEVRQRVEKAGFHIRSLERPKEKGNGKASSPKQKTVSVTVSIGAAEPDGRVTPEMVMKESDKALYKAKKAGRNRVTA